MLPGEWYAGGSRTGQNSSPINAMGEQGDSWEEERSEEH
ncbi:hypothetical protein SAMN04488694_14918 [Natrinema hispanicum]|uniref:Uncharacterized protein n=1 Tax=Natrinema hispanicum TaxID=392421 RepID=A0A1I0JLP4_9EURY|nr:hypothetical protein SAMN04488694_14918 [Natrinema hispanicum]